LLSSCPNNDLKMMTVKEEIPVSKMGVTISSQYVLVVIASIDSVAMSHYNRNSVIVKVSPFPEELKQYKVQTFGMVHSSLWAAILS
jgi:hypothetical protein